MKQIAVIDAETDPFLAGRIPAPFLWGVYHETESGFDYREFVAADNMMRFLIGQPWIVYAHNGGRFDYHFLLDYIPTGTALTIINGRIAKFKIGECEFRDSYNILPVSLARMQKTKIDYAIFEAKERIKPHNAKLISDYLYDDCRFLYKHVMLFIDKYGQNLTLAGTAMKTWEAMRDEKAPNDTGGYIYKKFKAHYHGGRCQAFMMGDFDKLFTLYDINSAYPFAMLSQHPISLEYERVTHREHGKVAELFFDLPEAKQGGVMITVQAKSTGAFPMRGDDYSLTFPTDNETRIFNVTGWEFLAALDCGLFYGHIVEFYIADEYTDFTDYVERFYNERNAAKAAGNNADDLFAKLLMNSLYGKFGSNPETYRSYITIDPELVNSDGALVRGQDLGTPHDWVYAGELGNLYLADRPLDDNEQRYYNVMTAASITGFVRAMLLRAMHAIKENGGQVYYCDTDSILCTGENVLDCSGDLGDWKIEGCFNRAAIAGKKLYALQDIDNDKWKIASKGARLNHTDIIEIVNGATVSYAPDAPTFSVHKSPRFVTRNIKRI